MTTIGALRTDTTPQLYVGIQISRNREGMDWILSALPYKDSGTGVPALRIESPCGRVKEMRTCFEFPLQDDECQCGELGYPHYFVRWQSPTREVAS